MTPAQFDKWVRTAEPGEPVVYFTGLLMYSRQRESFTPDYRDIDDLAKRSMAASEKGHVALTQHRRAPGVCDYIATRL